MPAPRLALALAALAATFALAACNEPVPPDKQDPPEPQAPQATELRDAIQAPIDKARAVDTQVKDAAQQQRDAIEAQAGG
jgi:hypothetical protein